MRMNSPTIKQWENPDFSMIFQCIFQKQNKINLLVLNQLPMKIKNREILPQSLLSSNNLEPL
jgi:hypothetical protein